MYTEFLTKIKNAQKANKPSLKVPFSNLDMAIAEILVEKGFLASAAKKGRMPKRIIEVELKYDAEGKGVITDIRFVSVPSRRIYRGYKEIRLVRQGYGIVVLSTPKGLLTGDKARKEKIGGQVLFEIW